MVKLIENTNNKKIFKIKCIYFKDMVSINEEDWVTYKSGKKTPVFLLEEFSLKRKFIKKLTNISRINLFKIGKYSHIDLWLEDRYKKYKELYTDLLEKQWEKGEEIIYYYL